MANSHILVGAITNPLQPVVRRISTSDLYYALARGYDDFAVLLVIGSIPFFVGLTVVMPVLGHATWHLYRRAVEPDPNPHPDYTPRERPRRSAADFPAALFPTRE